MSKKELGQAFILVLIILAIGSLVTVPALRLTQTTLQSATVIGTQNRGLYACEAVQQLVMWKLYHDIDGIVSEQLQNDGDSANFTVDVCGTIADVNVVMRAVELEGGVILATEHTMMPMKTVVPNQVESKGVTDYFTYNCNSAGRSYLASLTGRSTAEEKTERISRSPVG